MGAPNFNRENLKFGLQESSAKLTNQRVSNAFTSSPFSFHARHVLPTSKFQHSYSCIGSRALSFSDPYFHFTCLSVRHSVVLSFCLSATSELNISETRPDSGMVTMDGLYKLAYGLSIGHTPDDVT